MQAYSLHAYICKSLPVISIQKTNILTLIGMEAISILKDRIKKRKVPNICVVQMTVVLGTSWTASKHYRIRVSIYLTEY